ncbi:MAG: hypothetical protein RSD57_16170 [Comamonas sp.]
MKSFESIAQHAYERFCNSLYGSAAVRVTWDELSQQTRNAWGEVSRQVAEEIQHIH